MRLAAIALALTLLPCVTASAQAPAPEPHPYGLDPYKPSDAAILRQYGAALVAQTPLLELQKLDPYKPSHAALLRQMGGAIPIWGSIWYPAPVGVAPGFAPLTPFPAAGATGAGADVTGPAGTNVGVIGASPNDPLPPANIRPDKLPDSLPKWGPQPPARTLQASANAQ